MSENPVQEPKTAPQPPVKPQPQAQQNTNNATPNIPSQYQPLSPWAYIGYSLLFSIPLVGFIMVLVFSFDSTNNINRRNFARSQLYTMIIAIVLSLLIFILIIAVFGIGLAAFSSEVSSSSSSVSIF